MARHNRIARGCDQREKAYEVGYQPDWVRLIKVTRTLASGRQSTKTLFRNSTKREQPPGHRIRTNIESREQKLEFEIELNDPQGLITRVIVETRIPGVSGAEGKLVFTIDGQPPRRSRASAE